MTMYSAIKTTVLQATIPTETWDLFTYLSACVPTNEAFGGLWNNSLERGRRRRVGRLPQTGSHLVLPLCCPSLNSHRNKQFFLCSLSQNLFSGTTHSSSSSFLEQPLWPSFQEGQLSADGFRHPRQPFASCSLGRHPALLPSTGTWHREAGGLQQISAGTSNRRQQTTQT